jgi:hypothetical protein
MYALKIQKFLDALQLFVLMTWLIGIGLNLAL